MDYEIVIGLEVHCQLLTETKIFCGCSTNFGNQPNENTCPVCTGMPGALPVLNRKVVDFAIRAGLATDCAITPSSIFARKNYFYPDLPKGYQISQFELPICIGGHLDIEAEGETKRIGITRIHMEEDAGKLVHPEYEHGVSFVDYNRACVPLIEIVSEPDMRSAAEAIAYLKSLRDIMVYLGVCDGNMEEGSFRCDANISLRRWGAPEFGIRAELKNMNSFRNVHRAIDYEVERQGDILDSGGTVVQETRLWNVDRGISMSMRGKEEAHDYRYFPDPDLLPVVIADEWIEEVRQSLPELPKAKRQRFVAEYAIPVADAEVLTADHNIADYFEAVVKLFPQPKAIANWIMVEMLKFLNEDKISIVKSPVTPSGLAELLQLIADGTISGKIGKQVFAQMYSQADNNPRQIIDSQGLAQMSDSGELIAMIDEILAANSDKVKEYQGGKSKMFGFFVGQVMKKSKGQANPQMVNELIKERIG
ncbi:MAG: Asp-tRNA(Asn)/Glu-tRNA(Gln) amidotransferase GatCAB subunit B [Deltaproteobacteria bacterium]|nr:MAG: Asp-tRNA(Asn)/Glu-tRNA(Gln) amidotransferase GatCAB subunit B [Deltaproteobacteria bacterium]